MPAPAARIKELQFRRVIRPRRKVVLNLTLIVDPLLSERAFWMSLDPPGAERVLEQKLYHIGLGEELGHCTDVIPLHLLLRCIQFLLLVCLPELVGPPEGISSAECLFRDPHQDRLECSGIFGRILDLDERTLLPEDPREHL